MSYMVYGNLWMLANCYFQHKKKEEEFRGVSVFVFVVLSFTFPLLRSVDCIQGTRKPEATLLPFELAVGAEHTPLSYIHPINYQNSGAFTSLETLFTSRIFCLHIFLLICFR